MTVRAILAALILVSPSFHGRAWAYDVPSDSKATTRIRRQLRRLVSFNQGQVEVAEFANIVRRKFHINVVIDSAAFEADNVPEDQVLNAQTTKVSLRAALNLILHPCEMDWTIRNDSLVITSQAAATDAENEFTRVYDITDLLPRKKRRRSDALDSISVALSQIEPYSWSEQTVSNQIEFVSLPRCHTIVIHQVEAVHYEIENLLAALRRSNKSNLSIVRKKKNKRNRRR